MEPEKGQGDGQRETEGETGLSERERNKRERPNQKFAFRFLSQRLQCSLSEGWNDVHSSELNQRGTHPPPFSFRFFLLFLKSLSWADA